jgi:hypothetical protein
MLRLQGRLLNPARAKANVISAQLTVASMSP